MAEQINSLEDLGTAAGVEAGVALVPLSHT